MLKNKIIEVLHDNNTTTEEGEDVIKWQNFDAVATDLEVLFNQEVERRIAERMPSREVVVEYEEKTLSVYEDAPICEIDYYGGFEDGVEWLRSRLTKDGVNSSQKTEGHRTLTDTEIKEIFNNGEPLCKQLHKEQQMWHDITTKDREE
jgi:hypothetical protein